jgi:PBSX family phage terminase large subunit
MTTRTRRPQPKQNEHRYSPRGACKELFGARDAEVLVAGPAGTGKSRACMEKLHIMMLLTPGSRGLIARKSATSLSSTALKTWENFVAKEAIEAGDMKYFGGSAREPASYQYKNGSVVAIGGLDKVSKIMSAEYDIIYIQEATELTENDWEALTTRLRNWKISFQQILGDCNPQQPDHWLKKRADRGATRLLVSVHEDNPILFTRTGEITENGASYIEKLDALTGVRYKRLRRGLWVAAEGVIYEDYLSTTHMITRADIRVTDENVDPNGIPMSWNRYWSVDFGYTHPFVCQFWAEDGDGRLYLYREIYHTRRTVDQHAKLIRRLVQNERGSWTEPRPRAIVCDHDAEGRATLEQELGMGTEAAHKSVLEGLDTTQRRFVVQPDGKPRIFFFREAVVERDPDLEESGKPTSTVDELPGYVWADKKTKEEPVKEDDHGCDAMRYIAAQREFGIRPMYRSFPV